MTNNGEQNQMTPKSLTRYWMMGAAAAIVLIAAVFAGVLAANYTLGDDDDDEIPHTEIGGEQAFMAPRINPPWPKPEVELTDTEGNPYDIVAETEGEVTLVYLGYTNCPDICPTHMNDIAATLDTMDPEDAEEVNVIFITTDPERDTPEVMRRWLNLFGEDFVGLTADQETIDEVQVALGVEPARPFETERAGDGYEVSHAAFVYAFDQTNLAHLVFPGGVDRETWLHDLTKLVQEGWTES